MKHFQKKYMKVGVKKLLGEEDLVSPCSGDGSHGEVEMEETDGSSTRQKKYDFVVPIHGSIWS